MTLSDLASLGSFVSGLAVLLSLVYLALQVRQAKHHQQSLIVQGQTARVLELYAQIIGDEGFARILDKARESTELSSTEILRLLFFYRAIALSREESYRQRKAGLMDEASFESLKGASRLAFSSRSARAHWVIERQIFSADYAAWVDELISNTPASPPVDLVERWKDAMTAVQEREVAPA